MPRNPDQDLYRTRACRHYAADQNNHDFRGCKYYHDLQDAQPPLETEHLYDYVWSSCQVDRFYGQAMLDEQVLMIKAMWSVAPPPDRPLWATALVLLSEGAELEAGFAYPWDFGLCSDSWNLQRTRRGGLRPFDWMPHLWDRLSARREVMMFKKLDVYRPYGYSVYHHASPYPGIMNLGNLTSMAPSSALVGQEKVAIVSKPSTVSYEQEAAQPVISASASSCEAQPATLSCEQEAGVALQSTAIVAVASQPTISASASSCEVQPATMSCEQEAGVAPQSTAIEAEASAISREVEHQKAAIVASLEWLGDHQ